MTPAVIQLPQEQADSPPPTVWLIGGTSESRELAAGLVNRGVPCVVTVTTDAARSLYASLPQLRIRVGKLQPPDLEAFCRLENIRVILDASHPWAVQISQLAMAVATNAHLPYLRYERPSLPEILNSSIHQRLKDFATLLAGDYLTNQRVLLTIGYQPLPLFQPWQEQATLFARVLPSAQSLQVAQAAGFTSDRLIALRPPVPEALELALWHHWRISLVVTKASGIPSGEEIKRNLGDRLQIPLITIERPPIDYLQHTNRLETALDFALTVL